MSLKRIEIAGFKSLRELKLNLRALNVLIGANGAGKSNFISLFEMLNQMTRKNFQLFVPQKGGANALLHFGEKNTARITLKLLFEQNEYACSWAPTVDDRLVFEEESCGSVNGNALARLESFGSGHQESKLPDAVPSHHTLAAVLENLKSQRVYHFHDTSESAQMKKIGDINGNLFLRPDAGNLAAFLFRLQTTHPEHYEAIRDTIRLVAPFFDDFILRPLPQNEHKIQLEWRERGSDYSFLAHHLSDGTLRFICLATLLLQPEPPSTVIIDEPELGLHPYAVHVLASLLRSAAERTQIVVCTQSVTLVDQFAPEDLLIVERVDGATVIAPLEPERLSSWLEEYTLGELWEKNVIGGRPSP